jgi:hypothetical protein
LLGDCSQPLSTDQQNLTAKERTMVDQQRAWSTDVEPGSVDRERLGFADQLITGSLKFVIITWYLPVLLVALVLSSLAVVIWQCVLVLELCWHRVVLGWGSEIRDGWKPGVPIDLAEEGA